MHPSHVPLITEIQSVIFDRTSYFRPCSRLFCNHYNARISAEDQCIDMLKELDCLKVFISTIDIWNPLTVFLTIIQIQHGRNRIYTQSIYMVIFYPHQSTSDQEILNLILAVIKNLRSPVRMLAFS